MLEGNFWKVLEEHLKAAPPGPGIHVARILHDDDCPVFDDLPCSCEPEVLSGPLIDRMYGLGDDE